VIAAVEAMAERQGIKSLKIANHHGVVYHPADWIAGVDYDDTEAAEADLEEVDDEDFIKELDDILDNDDLDDWDRIEQDEIDDLLLDDIDTSNPTPGTVDPTDEVEEEPEEEQELEEEAEAEDTADATEDPAEEAEPDVQRTRSNRAIVRPDYLSPGSFQGSSYMQKAKKKVTFEMDKIAQLEHCHNLVVKEQPNPNDMWEYTTLEAVIITKCMLELKSKVTIQGASFAQQYLLEKGLKMFGKRGSDATNKEMDQLHKQHCFNPLSVAELTPSEKEKAMEALMLLSEKRTNQPTFSC
jgi:hypothetical protein